jgi:urocanate hydratase
MIQNNLDPEVAERPEALVVYGGIGRAARNWDAYDRILEALKNLEPDETLLIQSGKPVGVFRTHSRRAARAARELEPGAEWATWEHFNELDQKGLMMYGQMTAGSWIYIGSQGIVQGTYETFAEAARQHFGGNPQGKWILTAGLGGMGGAQPLAATMAGFSMLAIECDESRIDMRLRTRYLDRKASTLDEGLAMMPTRMRTGKRSRSASLGNAAEMVPELARRARDGGGQCGPTSSPTRPARTTRLRLPAGRLVDRAVAAHQATIRRGHAGREGVDGRAHRAILEFHRMGIPCVDYGNNLRQMAFDEGVPMRSRSGIRSGVRAAALLPRHRTVPLGRALGRSGGHLQDRREGQGTDPDDAHLHHWLDMARERIQFQGLPARICWVGLGDRHRSEWLSTRWSRAGD